MRYKLAIAATALVLSAPALAEDWDLVLTNGTTSEIKTLEISAAGAATWAASQIDPEIKREPSIRPAARTTFKFDKPGKQCRYDIRATFVDGATATWSGINVCDNAYITLRNKDGKPTFAAN
jgi:hypothetical protein